MSHFARFNSCSMLLLLSIAQHELCCCCPWTTAIDNSNNSNNSNQCNQLPLALALIEVTVLRCNFCSYLGECVTAATAQLVFLSLPLLSVSQFVVFVMRKMHLQIIRINFLWAKHERKSTQRFLT